MARKLYALALEKCAPESADNPMMQEVLLGGHFYLMCLKVVERNRSISIYFFFLQNWPTVCLGLCTEDDHDYFEVTYSCIITMKIKVDSTHTTNNKV